MIKKLFEIPEDPENGNIIWKKRESCLKLCPVKNKRMSDMFPKNLNLSNFSVWNKERYHVNHANTERYRNSTIPFLQRKLNERNKIERKRLRALLQLNCVSYLCWPYHFMKIKTFIIIIIIASLLGQKHNILETLILV